MLIRSQAREIFASSHALASPADEAVRFLVMVEAGKADARSPRPNAGIVKHRYDPFGASRCSTHRGRRRVSLSRAIPTSPSWPTPTGWDSSTAAMPWWSCRSPPAVMCCWPWSAPPLWTARSSPWSAAPSRPASRWKKPQIASSKKNWGGAAGRLDFLGELHPFKYLTTRQFVFLACDLTLSKLAGDETHAITERRVSLNDFTDLCQAGELQDASAIAALCLARNYFTRSNHREVEMGSVEESDKL